MKIIHCADLHLDSKLNANLSKAKAKERKQEILNTFVRMVDFADKNKVSAILICGDLFDTKNISALSRNTFKEAVISHPEIVFFYLKGNHDKDNLMNSFEEVPENLVFFNDSWSSYALGDTDRVVIHGVELSAENSVSVQNNFAPDPSKVNIVMLHGQEAETDVKDKAEIINLKLFRNKGINYLALGHIHEYKRAELDGFAKYSYSGCLEGRGFDETGDHGFVLLDIDESRGTVEDSFVSFAYRRIYEIPVDVSGLNNTPAMLEEVRKGLNESPAKDIDLVKVVLTGEVDVECEKDTDFIRRTFEEDFYFLKVYDKTILKVDPKSYMYDSSLKGEFVRTVLGACDITEEEKGEIIRIGLETLMGGKPVV